MSQKKKKSLITADFANGLLISAMNYTENNNTSLTALNKAAEQKNKAAIKKVAENNARMKSEAAKARQNPNQMEMFGDQL